MSKKFMSLILVLCLISSVCAQPLSKTKAKKKVKKAVTQIISPTVAPAAKSAVDKTEPSKTEIDEDKDNTSDLREDVNAAVKDLKNQIESVKSDNSDAKVSGVIYMDYGAPLNNGISQKGLGFDITRAYVNFKEKLGSDASVRITLDAARFAANTTTGVIGSAATATSAAPLLDFLKYAYVEMPLMGMTARLGLQQTAWIDYDESVWNNRYIMKTLLDNEGVMSSSDFGIGATGLFTLPYMPEVQYMATLTNGAGYKSSETNDAKDIGVRLNSTVYSDDNIGKLTLAALLNMKDQLVPTTTNSHQAAAEVSFSNSDYGTAYAEYVKGNLSALPIEGSSVGGYLYPMPSMLPGVALIARADRYNSNTSKTDGSTVTLKTLYGVSYDYGKNIKFAIDEQTSQTGSAAVANIMYLNTQVTF